MLLKWAFIKTSIHLPSHCCGWNMLLQKGINPNHRWCFVDIKCSLTFLKKNLLRFLTNPSGRQTGNQNVLGQSDNKRNHLILTASHFKEIYIFRPHVRLKCSNRHFLQCRSVHQGCRLERGSDGNQKLFGRSGSALSIPAPDRSVVTHSYQNAAVAAEAGLPNGRRAFGEGQCGAPGDQRGDCCHQCILGKFIHAVCSLLQAFTVSFTVL